MKTTSTCWSCGAPGTAAEPLCPSCGKVQPPPPAGTRPDKFTTLGFEPSLDEHEGLDERFRALARKLHPDRFARATAQERRYSLEQTTRLNDAYKTLKDSVRRAEHLLQLRGIEGDPKMSPEFLEQTMEDREKLLEAKMSGQALAVDEGSALLPSVVHYGAGGGPGSVVIGRPARRLAAEFPRDTIASVKRFMGRSSADPETRRLSPYRFAEGDSSVVRFVVAGGRVVNPVEVSAEVLRALRTRAEDRLGIKVNQAVITVPAYLDDAHRQATKEARRLAGLEVLRLLNEPTAAAPAYRPDQRSRGMFAVYDLGGGTFDISILQLQEGVFEVKAVGGDSALGGDDFDRALAEILLQGREHTPRLVREAIDAAKQAKEELTKAEVTEALGKRVTRAQLETAIGPLIEKTGGPSRRALR